MKGPELRRFITARLAAPEPSGPRPAGVFGYQPERRAQLAAGRPFTPAAVLVPLFERDEELHVLLTRRADNLSNHAGQISFPGGRVDPVDPHPVDTALREAEEEIALDRLYVDIVGQLGPYYSGTGFTITPVIGFLKQGFSVAPQEAEVAEIFDVPFTFLMDPGNHQRHQKDYNGVMRQYYAMPYGRHYIWGATAGMLLNFCSHLGIRARFPS
jgi:8-oxo-dGTP pyrophosphatase MutT (NUDIX family)